MSFKILTAVLHSVELHFDPTISHVLNARTTMAKLPFWKTVVCVLPMDVVLVSWCVCSTRYAARALFEC